MIINRDIEITDVTHYYRKSRDILIHCARLDLLHPIVSGNKIFKLRYFLEEAKKSGIKKMVTYGGAYSNHLAAAAFACRESALELTAIIRGEAPPSPSHTLKACRELGMKMEFVSREKYASLTSHSNPLGNIITEDRMTIPEGGYHLLGMKGAAEILHADKFRDYSHVITAAGTATTMAGLIQSAGPGCKTIGINVLKGPSRIRENLSSLLGFDPGRHAEIPEGYHFGGYARHTPELINHMNAFFNKTGIPTDFVYTGKMTFAVNDLVQKDYFPAGSQLLLLHTGGLQGNASLPAGVLEF